MSITVSKLHNLTANYKCIYYDVLFKYYNYEKVKYIYSLYKKIILHLNSGYLKLIRIMTNTGISSKSIKNYT